MTVYLLLLNDGIIACYKTRKLAEIFLEIHRKNYERQQSHMLYFRIEKIHVVESI